MKEIMPNRNQCIKCTHKIVDNDEHFHYFCDAKYRIIIDNYGYKNHIPECIDGYWYETNVACEYFHLRHS